MNTIKRTATEVILKRQEELNTFINTYNHIRDKIEDLRLFSEKALICRITAWRYRGVSDSEIVSYLNGIDSRFWHWTPHDVEMYLDIVIHKPEFAHLFYNYFDSPLENLQNAVTRLNNNKRFKRTLQYEYEVTERVTDGLYELEMVNTIYLTRYSTFRYNKEDHVEMFHSIMNLAYSV